MHTRMAPGLPLGGVVAFALVLAGCGAGATAAPATPGEPASPSARPSASPSASADRTPVTGVVLCSLGVPGGEETPDPAAPTPAPGHEPMGLTCTHRMSDPRVNGTEVYLYDQIGATSVDTSLGIGIGLWEDVPLTLTTPGGTWVGRGVGADIFQAPMLETIGHAVYEGQGAYAGLTYTVMLFREIDVNDISPDPFVPGVYDAAGWIEPAG